MMSIEAKLIAMVLAVAALVGGYNLWAHHERAIGAAPYVTQLATLNAALKTQKDEAAKTLAAETTKVAAAHIKLSELINSMEKNGEQLQAQNTADLHARAAGPRLQFATQAAGCGRGGGGAQGAAAGPASDPAPTLVQLPEPLDANLRQYAADAQSLAIDYDTLFRYVHNPDLVCELRPATQ